MNIEFEMLCLNRYKDIITYQHEVLEAPSTLEEDLDLLKSAQDSTDPEAPKLSPNSYNALLYRTERKKIVRSQLDLINYLIQVVVQSEEIASDMQEGAKKFEIDAVFKRIYFTKSE